MTRERTRPAIAAVLGTFASTAAIVTLATLAPAAATVRDAAGVPLVRIGGVILGKTPASMDVQIGTGLARMDQRFELPADARVYVAGVARLDDLRAGTVVGVAFARGSRTRVRAVVVYPRDAAGRTDRAIARDLTAGDDGAVAGVVVAPHVIVVREGRAVRRVRIARGAAVETLERGGIADLTTDGAVTITASAPGSGAEDVLRSAIVGKGDTVPPV